MTYYSDRLGASAHQMCMDICKGKNISKTLLKKTYINDDYFKYAVDGFIKRSSDTFKSIYDAAVKNELGWYILKTFSHNAKGKLSFFGHLKENFTLHRGMSYKHYQNYVKWYLYFRNSDNKKRGK